MNSRVRLLRNYVRHQTAILILSLHTDRYQQETNNLIGTAYTSIFETTFSEMLNQSPETVAQLCNSLGWQLIDGNPRLIMPKKPVPDMLAQTACEDQMKKLTEFVSFLES